MTEGEAVDLIDLVLLGGGSADDRRVVLDAVSGEMAARGIDRRTAKTALPDILADERRRAAFVQAIGETIRRKLTARTRGS